MLCIRKLAGRAKLLLSGGCLGLGGELGLESLKGAVCRDAKGGTGLGSEIKDVVREIESLRGIKEDVKSFGFGKFLHGIVCFFPDGSHKLVLLLLELLGYALLELLNTVLDFVEFAFLGFLNGGCTSFMLNSL